MNSTAENTAAGGAETRAEIYQSLFDDAPVAYHEIDRWGVLTRVNRAECLLLGYEPEEMVGRPVWEFLDAEEQEISRETVRQKVRGIQPLAPFERNYRRKDGGRVRVEIHERLIRNAVGTVLGIRTCLLDITERKQAEAALHRQTAELARSNTELEQFAYVASHDLQEPLRKIQAFGDRLKTKYREALPDEARDYLERMQNAAGRMQVLIDDLLTLSRVATQGRPFAAVDLGEVAQIAVSDLESRIQLLGGEVLIEPLPVVQGDRGQLGQLFQNLIGNALKFHRPEVPPRVRLRSAQAGNPAGRRWEISVEDNGIGFEEKYGDRIFQIFQRLHGRGEYDGTGIGLAVCRKIVERHGGTITAHSTPGVGSNFTITFPCVVPEDLETGVIGN